MPTAAKTCCFPVYTEPAPVIYVYPDLTFIDPVTGAVKVVSYYINSYGLPTSAAANKCLLLVNGTSVIDSSIQTITPADCPCCPDNYTYNSFYSMCQGIVASNLVDPIPCVTCTCIDTSVNPDCPTCGTSGSRITFSWDFTKANCTTCPPHDITNPPGGIQKFLPEQYLDPITSTFVLRNKNFI